MAEKVAIAGQVEDVQPSNSSFRVGGRWYEKAQRSEHRGLPDVGDVVRFDAYGQKQNLWYRFQAEDSGNGTSGAVAAHSNAGGVNVPAGAGNGAGDSVRVVGNPRGAALMAAAMLLQGIDGTVESAAQSALVVAGIFEQYLGGQA